MTVKKTFCRRAQGSLLVLLATVSLHAVAADTYYRWQDESGSTVMSDRPPEGRTGYDVVSGNAGLRRTQAVPAQHEVRPKELEPGDEFQQVAKTTADEVPKNSATCAIARKNLETLNTFARVQVTDNDGVISYLGDEEKQAQRSEARALIQRHCN